MRFWRARNRRNKQPVIPLKVIELVGNQRFVRDPRPGEDLSQMIVGGNHCISPADLQKMSQMKMVRYTDPPWQIDPSYWWRRKGK